MLFPTITVCLQCIPTPLAWWAHQLPEWFLKLGVVATFVYEIPVPLMFFSPVRSQRVFAFYTQVSVSSCSQIILVGFLSLLYVCTPIAHTSSLLPGASDYISTPGRLRLTCGNLELTVVGLTSSSRHKRSLGAHITFIGSGPVIASLVGRVMMSVSWERSLKFGLRVHQLPRNTSAETGSGTKYK